jgi:cell division protease FtsH
MVMEFGMSRLGPVNYRERRGPMLLGGPPDMPSERSHSEQTAREIDEEIKRIVDDSLEKVRHILETRRKALESLAQRLIEKEVIDTDELKEIVEASASSPLIVPGTDSTPKRPQPGKADAAKSDKPASDAGEASG